LKTLIAHSDFITLHVPLTDQTQNILSRDNLNKTKKGVRIVNCARGGLVDEAALAELQKSGYVAGAAFDVFSDEPAIENPFFLIFQMWFAHPTWVLQQQKRKKM